MFPYLFEKREDKELNGENSNQIHLINFIAKQFDNFAREMLPFLPLYVTPQFPHAVQAIVSFHPHSLSITLVIGHNLPWLVVVRTNALVAMCIMIE